MRNFNLEKKIFSLAQYEDFERLALEVFTFQYENCKVYQDFCNALGKKNPTCLEEIPFLPISFFKTHPVAVHSDDFESRFLSSGTTGALRSQHLVAYLDVYETSFLKTYKEKIGDPANQVILALLPNYIEQGHSSLVYMVDRLIKESASPMSGFYLNNLTELISRVEQAKESSKQVVLFGVSYALLDLCELGVDCSHVLVIETGGMKGRRKELLKEELHQILKERLNTIHVSSEYGMTELLSQAYLNNEGWFVSPNWMKIKIRDLNDPLSYVKTSKTGVINVIDLANLYSCSFIATDDLGIVFDNKFKVLGRVDHSDIRGCNLMVQ